MCGNFIPCIRNVWIRVSAYMGVVVMAREYVPDMYDMWEAYDIKQEMERGRRQVCDECGENIMEDWCYCIDNKYYCERCMDRFSIATPVED